MDIEKAYNFRRVSDRLTTSGVVGAEALRALQAQGYEAVINLLPDASEHATAGEKDIIESQKIEYVYIPVDFAAPRDSDFAQFAEALDRLNDRKLHLHCAANYRVSAFLGMYMVERVQWSAERATDFIHDLWQPAEHPAWSHFIASSLKRR